MILSVALNAALDVTYVVEHLSQGEAVRVKTVSARPGGKGVNVAHVLAALGIDVAVAGFVGGCRGRHIRELLAGSGVRDRLATIAGESRQTVVAIAGGDSFAEYDEPGPEVSTEEWRSFLAEWPAMLEECSSVVLAGSLPPGLPHGAYGVLAAAARARGRTLALDAGGSSLEAGLAAEPDLVKLNRAELADFARAPLTDDSAVIEAAQALRAGGAKQVVATLGADGAVALGDGWGYRIRHPARRGSPVGAGDAFTAGLVASETAFPERLAFAAALAASSVGLGGAGMVDLNVARQFLKTVEVARL